MLGGIQQQLENRFAELAAGRHKLKYPVYALEHGLDDHKIAALKDVASQSIRYQPPSSTHWLVWAVLGAEAGYGYSGDEYWPALEVAPGDWRSNDLRQTLKGFYQRFAKEFQGPIPTGRWAEHFKIIAWPISHAILPLYLQSRFARHLYDYRFDLAPIAAGNGEGLGDFLFEKYDGTSSRFRDFLQQTDLTSQIVLALRDEDIGGRVPRIDRLVLGRIVSDLEKRSDARSYLRDTRKLIQSTSIKVSSRLQPIAGNGQSADTAGSASLQKTRLVARRQEDGSVLIGLQLPDIGVALKRGGASTGLLAGHRIRFVGTNEPYVPASNLLTLSRKERRLETFPDPCMPIFAIENGSPELLLVLDPISRIEERPCWVLRQQMDGRYREVVGGHVRPGQEYLILLRGVLPDTVALRAGASSVDVKATGIHAYRLSTPDHLGKDQRDGLAELGLGTITGVTIEAVGINPAPSQARDPPTWLLTEAVTLRLKADFDADAFLVGIDGHGHQKFSCVGGELFLQFDQLELGRHNVSVAVWTKDGRASSFEEFDFKIATPRPWIRAMRDKAGFRLMTEPKTNKIDCVFNGQASLRLVAPAGRNVRWSFETYTAAGHFAEALDIGKTKVGASQDALRSMLTKARTEHTAAMDEAYRIDIVAALEELGRQALPFAHEVEPLRWKFDSETGVVRLIDETDHAEPVSVCEYRLETPLAKRIVEIQKALSGIAIVPPGSLFVAIYQKRRVPIFVSLPHAQKLRELAELGLSQSVPLSESPAKLLIRLIDSLRRWERARAVGHLAPLRKAMTVDRLRREISIIACGPDFIDHLRSSDPKGDERAQRKIGGSPGFGLRMRTTEWPTNVDAARGAFSQFASTFGIENDQEWCRAALTLAFEPLSLRPPENADSTEYFAQLLTKRTLLRGAFFAKTVSSVIQTEMRATV